MSAQVLLTPRHHALLFAWLARQVVDQVGEQRGEEIMRQAVWCYGLERGQRMAQRVLADGGALDYAHYLAYGEWQAEPGSSQASVLETQPDLHQRVTRCPWFGAWDAAGLLRYGGLYCQRIDVALLQGYNPALTLVVSETLSNGGQACDFRFVGVGLTQDALEQAAALKQQLAPRTVMPWTYHCAHLMSAVGHEIVSELGALGELLIGDALDDFEQAFGPEATAAITRLAQRDFSQAITPAALG